MDIVVLIFRILFLVLGSLVGLIYLLFQFYQKIPSEKFALSTADYIIYTVLALVFGFGTNSYIGLLAFVPLLLVKFICRKTLLKNRLYGSGRWMEIDWKKLTPRGFERNVPRHLLEEMNKVVNNAPKDVHFLIPRFYAVIAIHIMLKRMTKESKKAPVQFSQAQQNMGVEQLTGLASSILKLEKGKVEKKDLNIGVLKVTRL